MTDIYNLLSKYFFGKINEEEKKQIANYKADKTLEYKLYEELVKKNNLSESEFVYFVRIISDI
jgi:hypothetical protein